MWGISTFSYPRAFRSSHTKSSRRLRRRVPFGVQSGRPGPTVGEHEQVELAACGHFPSLRCIISAMAGEAMTENLRAFSPSLRQTRLSVALRIFLDRMHEPGTIAASSWHPRERDELVLSEKSLSFANSMRSLGEYRRRPQTPPMTVSIPREFLLERLDIHFYFAIFSLCLSSGWPDM